MYNFNPYANFTKRSKYGNKKTVLGNVVYDSQKEANRAFELALLVKNGVIKDLKRQVPYVLLPKQLGKDGKVLFRECKYVADFEYIVCKTGEKVVEDVKGYIVPEFKLKQKMMMYFHGIEVKVIE